MLAVALSVLALAIYTASIVRFGFERTREVQTRIAVFEREGLQVADVPEPWLQDLLAVEDPAFYTHRGIDLRTPGAGMTTLTQGLVKIHYFDDFQPGLAKYKQSVLALVLDREIPKQDQLLLMLNSVGLGRLEGRRVEGFADAAVTYFGKAFDRLNREEFLALVAMIVGPDHYNVARHPRRNAERLARIERFVAGGCQPRGLRDVLYEDCQ